MERHAKLRGMEDAHTRRIAALRAHLASLSVSETQSMQIQDCAAANGIAYGRVEESKTSFARPSETIPDRDVRVFNTAMRFGEGAFEASKIASKLEGARNRALNRERNRALNRERVRKFRLMKRSEIQRRNVQDEMSNRTLVPNASTKPRSLPECFISNGWTPQVHKIIRGSQDTYIFLLPGVRKGDLKVSYDGKALKLTGTRLQGLSYVAPENGLEDFHVHTSSNLEAPSGKSSNISQGIPSTESSSTSFSVSYHMPDYGSQPKLRAQFGHGRLRIAFERKTLPNIPELSLRRRHNAGM